MNYADDKIFKQIDHPHLIHSWDFTEILEENIFYKEVYEFLLFSMRSHFLSFPSVFFSFHFFYFLFLFYLFTQISNIFSLLYDLMHLWRTYPWIGFSKFLLLCIIFINFSFLFLTWIFLFKLNHYIFINFIKLFFYVIF